MLPGAHKKFYRIQHPEIYLLDLKVQYQHEIKLPIDMVSKHVFLYLCLPDYNLRDSNSIFHCGSSVRSRMKNEMNSIRNELKLNPDSFPIVSTETE